MMEKLWTELSKYQRWLQVELAYIWACVELNRVPRGAAEVIQERAHINEAAVEKAKKIESKIKHDTLAFVRMLEEQVGPEGRYIHHGLTSSDVIDTANALAMREGLYVIIRQLENLRVALRSSENNPTAEDLLATNLARLRRTRENISLGKFSGSVGNYAHSSPRLEELACARLGLRPAKLSSQIINRDIYAEALMALALLSITLEYVCRVIGVPAKQITEKASLIRSYFQTALQNVALWHERDISHSSVERIILPGAFCMTYTMIKQLATEGHCA